jgi:hypothetical protein
MSMSNSLTRLYDRKTLETQPEEVGTRRRRKGKKSNIAGIKQCINIKSTA